MEKEKIEELKRKRRELDKEIKDKEFASRNLKEEGSMIILFGLFLWFGIPLYNQYVSDTARIITAIFFILWGIGFIIVEINKKQTMKMNK